MIPATASFDPPLPCTIDYFDEPDVTVPVAGWDPSWLYVIETLSDGQKIVCMVAWGNVVRVERAEVLL